MSKLQIEFLKNKRSYLVNEFIVIPISIFSQKFILFINFSFNCVLFISFVANHNSLYNNNDARIINLLRVFSVWILNKSLEYLFCYDSNHLGTTKTIPITIIIRSAILFLLFLDLLHFRNTFYKKQLWPTKIPILEFGKTFYYDRI